MGVDFYFCQCCKDSKYEEYVGYCTNCNKGVCTSCVVNDDINSSYASQYGVLYDGSVEMREKYRLDEDDYEIGDLIDDTSIDPLYCPFCQGEEVDEIDVYRWHAKENSLDYEALKAEYIKDRFK